MLFKKDFSAGGIEFSAWLDTRDRAAFALDTTRDEVLPDFMIILEPDPLHPDRKWDDILKKDFDTDPEIVRPREDNKYQKLDIQYSGLEYYQAIVNGDDSRGAVKLLKSFRMNAAAVSAQKRIEDNREILGKVTKTLATTKKTKSKIKSGIHDLTEKLASQRGLVGFEPTKAAASKILKTQSQIEALHEKAKKNETRAKRTVKKIEAAEGEIETNTEWLNRLLAMGAELPEPAAKADQEFDTPRLEDIPDEYEDEDFAEEAEEEAEAESDIQPLLEDNPEIVDNTKAFQNVDHEDEEKEEEGANMTEFKPMDWNAPTPSEENPNTNDWAKDVDSIKAPTQQEEAKVSGVPAADVASDRFQPTPPSETPSFAAPETTPQQPLNQPIQAPQPEPAPKTQYMQNAPARPAAAPGNEAATIARQDMTRRPAEPSGSYYLLLLLLVAVSIGALYLYQDKISGRVMPQLEPSNITEASPQPAFDPFMTGPQQQPAAQDMETGDAFLDLAQMDYIESFNNAEQPQPETIEERTIEIHGPSYYPVDEFGSYAEAEVMVYEELPPQPVPPYVRETNSWLIEEPVKHNIFYEDEADSFIEPEPYVAPLYHEGDGVISADHYIEPPQPAWEHPAEEVWTEPEQIQEFDNYYEPENFDALTVY
ncbi:MAG: hypothetical protein FWD33_02225 [Alphaproteobacteria bacterium]|nr:hypothetical protein [Alphaproteobacteria bacterium]